VLRQMFGFERGKAKGSCSKVYHEEFHKLYCSLNINRVIENDGVSGENDNLRGRKEIHISKYVQPDRLNDLHVVGNIVL